MSKEDKGKVPKKKATKKPSQAQKLEKNGSIAKKRVKSSRVDKSWHKPFLKELENHGVVSVAAKEADVSRHTAEGHRRKYKDFREAWEAAVISSIEALEYEAIKRARCFEENGYSKHSDILLMFLLKARKPHIYRDNYQEKQASEKLEISFNINPKVNPPKIIETTAEEKDDNV